MEEEDCSFKPDICVAFTFSYLSTSFFWFLLYYFLCFICPTRGCIWLVSRSLWQARWGAVRHGFMALVWAPACPPPVVLWSQAVTLPGVEEPLGLCFFPGCLGEKSCIRFYVCVCVRVSVVCVNVFKHVTTLFWNTLCGVCMKSAVQNMFACLIDWLIMSSPTWIIRKKKYWK